MTEPHSQRWYTAMLGDYAHPWTQDLLEVSGETIFDALLERHVFAAKSVLEAGCGVGAQTVTLARRSPGARFTSVDVSADSVAQAERRVAEAGLTNVETKVLDGENLDVAPESFDAVISRVGLIYFPDQQKALAVEDRVRDGNEDERRPSNRDDAAGLGLCAHRERAVPHGTGARQRPSPWTPLTSCRG